MIFMRHIKKFESYSINEEVTTIGGIDLDQLEFGFLTIAESEKFYTKEEKVKALQILNAQLGASPQGTKFAELVDCLLSTSTVSSNSMKSKITNLTARTLYYELLNLMKEKQDPQKIANLKIFIAQFAKEMLIVKGEDGQLINSDARLGAPASARESYKWKR